MKLTFHALKIIIFYEIPIYNLILLFFGLVDSHH